MYIVKYDFSKSLSLFQKSLSLCFRFFDKSSHYQKYILFLYMNNINDMTNKQLNKTPWSDDDDDDDDELNKDEKVWFNK